MGSLAGTRWQYLVPALAALALAGALLRFPPVRPAPGALPSAVPGGTARRASGWAPPREYGGPDLDL